MEGRNELFKKNVLEDSMKREKHLEDKILKDVILSDSLNSNI